MAVRPHSRASLTVPNLITLARILLTPLFIILLIQGRYCKALIVFLLADKLSLEPSNKPFVLSVSFQKGS